MKKILLMLCIAAGSFSGKSQILGNLVSINPNTAMQGQTLTTTITAVAGSYQLGSPPCDNFGIYLIQGNYTIYSTAYTIQWMDEYQVDFTIPIAAPPGFYDVYLAASYYDWWWGTCSNIGWWVLYSGFEVTGGTEIFSEETFGQKCIVSPNPFTEIATLSFNNPERKTYTLTVMDSFGKEIYRKLTDESHVILERKKLGTGIYFYKLESQEQKNSITGKFVVMTEMTR